MLKWSVFSLSCVVLILTGGLESSFSRPTTQSVIRYDSPTKASSPFSIWRKALIMRHAQSITVQVLLGNLWGSGVLVARRGTTYFVITNDHVIQGSDRLQIQTVDGQIHGARVNRSIQFGSKDLALLEFESDRRDYPLARWASGLPLPVGAPVFAGGFPIENKAQSTGSFNFTTGTISGKIPKSLEGGYQLGYSNLVLKGMSGGPVLNPKGEVVAINGVHAEPLWGDPYVFEDGSHPEQSLKALLFKSSWAIPSETVLAYLAPLPLDADETKQQQ